MAGFAQNIEKNKLRDRILLTSTKKISKADIKADSNWDFINNEYKLNQESSWLTKATVTLINSMFYQRRVVFAMTRKSFHNLLKNDENWKKGIGMRSENYSAFLSHVVGGKLLESIEYNTTGRKVLIFKLINTELLERMQIDITQQMKQTLDFAKYEGEFSKDKGDEEDLSNDIFSDPKLLVVIGQAVAKNKPKEYAALSEIDDIDKANQARRKLYLQEYKKNSQLYGEQ